MPQPSLSVRSARRSTPGVLRRAGLAPLAFGLLALLAAGAQAQTLRWSSQGDMQTADPHAQNEIITNAMNGQVYERLVSRDRNLVIVPGLATEWTQVSPRLWRFKLRQGVKFHDGTPFTADDVVFSVNRAKDPASQISVYAEAVGTPRKIDDYTVEFQLAQINPIFLQHIDLLFIMSRKWSETHGVARPQNFKDKQETYAATHSNGTGPYVMTSREPGIRTTFKRNPNWWGKFDGNVQDAVYTPIANDATRLAALVSGEIDFVQDPSPRDIPRLKQTAGVKVQEGVENRLVFVGMDQARDKLLYAKVPGDRNPFKDLRVRQALYQAIDINTLRTKLMNGLSLPTGGVTPSPLGAYDDPQLETRLPFDLAAARKLMADAGYANGFEVTLDCTNNRYVNDERICLALASMWAQIKVKVNVNAQPRVLMFPKLEKLDTSLYLYGWGGTITDAETAITPLMRNRGEKSVGQYNFGNWKDDKFDQLAAASSGEADPKKREELVKAALREFRAQTHLIPLHRQMIPWATRANVTVQHRPDNWFELRWASVAAK
ncbi:MAG: ABC transporter substrate-binding protein [Mitsuaria chitosanitabida]|uniref:ABC transporter substrate-binding protein n=1 Tax=Roseateles chitosanitabidus TaxID=65048 RepID=UPI001B2DE838|nr:ABC transporter substrate-binding protein [Roseateles chitosanitabidus]MBO9686196.1 ABC transporter substrate-binding protein [Roseateles chitosanitabidus]